MYWISKGDAVVPCCSELGDLEPYRLASMYIDIFSLASAYMFISFNFPAAGIMSVVLLYSCVYFEILFLLLLFVHYCGVVEVCALLCGC